MSASNAEWTVDMLDALPDDGQRYELASGFGVYDPQTRSFREALLASLLGP